MNVRTLPLPLLLLTLAAGCAAESDSDDSGAAISGTPSANLAREEEAKKRAPFLVLTKDRILERYAAAEPHDFELLPAPPAGADKASRWTVFNDSATRSGLLQRAEWSQTTHRAGYLRDVLVTERGTELTFWLERIQSGEPALLLRCTNVSATSGPSSENCY